MDDQTQFFDLADLSRKEARRTIALPIMSLALMLGVGGLAAYFTVLSILSGYPTPASLGAVILITLVWAFFGIAFFGFFAMGPGATSCRIDDRGVTLTYRGGKTRRYGWQDRAFKFDLAEVTTPSSTTYDLLTRIPSHNPLTLDAYQALLAEVRRRGLYVGITRSERPMLSVTINAVRANKDKALDGPHES